MFTFDKNSVAVPFNADDKPFIEGIAPLDADFILRKFGKLHFDISGNDDNDKHLLNIYPIFFTLVVFQFDILGNDDKDEHSLNKLFK